MLLLSTTINEYLLTVYVRQIQAKVLTKMIVYSDSNNNGYDCDNNNIKE